MRECLAEYHCEIHSMVVEDNKCFCRLRFTGKHVGTLLGYPPTQQTVAWMGASEYTIQNDKILKVWELGDVQSLEQQLRQTGGGDGGDSSSPTAAASEKSKSSSNNNNNSQRSTSIAIQLVD